MDSDRSFTSRRLKIAAEDFFKTRRQDLDADHFFENWKRNNITERRHLVMPSEPTAKEIAILGLEGSPTCRWVGGLEEKERKKKLVSVFYCVHRHLLARVYEDDSTKVLELPEASMYEARIHNLDRVEARNGAGWVLGLPRISILVDGNAADPIHFVYPHACIPLPSGTPDTVLSLNMPLVCSCTWSAELTIRDILGIRNPHYVVRSQARAERPRSGSTVKDIEDRLIFSRIQEQWLSGKFDMAALQPYMDQIIDLLRPYVHDKALELAEQHWQMDHDGMPEDWVNHQS